MYECLVNSASSFDCPNARAHGKAPRQPPPRTAQAGPLARREIQAKIKKAPRTLDHGVFLRLSGVRGSRLIVSHPYGHWGVDELEDVGLAYIDGGKERSWYYPGRTHLFVVGQPDVLAGIDLTYKVQ